MIEQWFDERIAIVTGGSQGIGRACALSLAKRGATVVVGDIRDSAQLKSIASDLTGNIDLIEADVTDPAALERVVEQADALGGLDILVNNAGVVARESITDLTHEQWDEVINVNLTGVYHAVKAAYPLLRDSGGTIVTVSSLLAQIGYPNRAAYSASKGGLDALTRALAAEMGPDGVRVNAVNPGFIRSEMTQPYIDAGRAEEYEARTAIGQLGEPEDVAETVAFLASDLAAFISGETLLVDGGQAALG